MMSTYTGGCACGKVRYEFQGPPKFSYICQCRDCQRATGSGHAPLMMFSSEDGTVAGQIDFFPVRSDSGNTISRGFCPGCGSPILITGTIYPAGRFVYAATLDEPDMFEPSRVIWNESACGWDAVDRSLPVHEKGT